MLDSKIYTWPIGYNLEIAMIPIIDLSGENHDTDCDYFNFNFNFQVQVVCLPNSII